MARLGAATRQAVPEPNRAAQCNKSSGTDPQELYSACGGAFISRKQLAHGGLLPVLRFSTLFDGLGALYAYRDAVNVQYCGLSAIGTRRHKGVPQLKCLFSKLSYTFGLTSARPIRTADPSDRTGLAFSSPGTSAGSQRQ